MIKKERAEMVYFLILLPLLCAFPASSMNRPPKVFKVFKLDDPFKEIHKHIRNAAKEGDIEQIKRLTAIGADINSQDEEGNTPLLFAIKAGQCETAFFLKEKGANSALCNKTGDTALSAAAYNGYEDLVLAFIKSSKNKKQALGTALLKAAAGGKIKLVEKLLDLGADSTTRDTEGDTALELALKNNHYTVVILLLERSSKEAETHKKNSFLQIEINFEQFYALLEEAIKAGCKGAIISLLQCNTSYWERTCYNNKTALMRVAETGNLEAVKFLVENRAKVNGTEIFGEPALLCAALNGHKEVAQFLIERGADYMNENYDIRTTVLTEIAKWGSEDFIYTIIQRSSHKRLALALAVVGAAQEGRIALVEKLLKLDKNFNEKDCASNGTIEQRLYCSLPVGAILNSQPGDKTLLNIALLAAVMGGRAVLAEKLLARGAHVNMKDSSGKTPLMCAAVKGNKELVTLLLQKGAQVRSKDHLGRSTTALDYASKKNHREIVEILLNKGAEIKIDVVLYSNELATAIKDAPKESRELIVHHIITLSDDYKKQCLLSLVKYDCLEAAALLLELAEDKELVKIINCDVKKLHKLLFVAVQGSCKKVVELLLHRGADSNAIDAAGITALMYAAQGSSIEVVDMLIKHGAHVNATDKKGNTPLFYAARHGHKEVAILLVEHGAAIDCQNSKKDTALIVALRTNHLQVAAVLVEKGANVNVQGTSTPLLLAAAGGYYDIVRMLCDRGADSNAKTESRYSTVLASAAENGHKDVVELLLKGGADVNICNSLGETSLFCAAEHGHEDVVETLFAHGADVTAKNYWNRSPLSCAVNNNHARVVEVFLKNRVAIDVQSELGKKALHLAAQYGCPEAVKLLMDQGISVRAYGNVPLLEAIKRNDEELVEVLVHQRDPIAIDSKDDCALLKEAINKNFNSIVRKIIEHSVDKASTLYYVFSHAMSSRNTAFLETVIADGLVQKLSDNILVQIFMKAVERGYKELVVLLLKNGINVHNRCCASALTEAVYYGFKEIVLLLLDAGVDSTIRDEKGKTLLMYAALRGHNEIARLLIARGADINAQCNDRNTALLYAAFYGHKEVVETLLAHKADSTIRNQAGFTALMQAVHNGHEAIVLMLLHSERESKINNRQDVAALITALKPLKLDRMNILFGLIEKLENEHDKRAALKALFLQACTVGKISIIKELSDTHIDMNNTVDSNGSTGLMLAAESGHYEAVQMFLEREVSLHTRDNYQRTAIMLAACQGQTQVVELLLKHLPVGTVITAFKAAISNNQIETAIHLIAQDSIEARIFLKREENNSCCTAVEDKLVTIKGRIAVLSKEKASTLVHLYERYEHLLELLKLLQAKDMQAYLANPLHYIPHANSRPQKNTKNQTVLMWASMVGHSEVVKLFLQMAVLQCSINAQDCLGRTALMYATLYGHTEVARLLTRYCDNGIHLKDNKGNTALCYAVSIGDEALVSALFGQGARPIARAIKLAAEQDNLKILRALLFLASERAKEANQGIVPYLL